MRIASLSPATTMQDFILLLRPYCEPVLDSGIEPLNTISNIGFIVVGLWILRSSKKTELLIVGLLTFLLGIGSTLWHSLRGVSTYFADTVPLALLLILVAILVFENYRKYASFFGFLAIGILYYVLEFHVTLADPGLSEIYFAVITVFFGVVILQFLSKREHAFLLLAAALLFAVGYSIRQLDQFFCHLSFLEYGTHWIWHLLCAGAIYFAVLYLQKTSLRK